MGELKEYLKEKGLEVNSKKSKIIRFGKRVEKRRKGKWKWGKDEIEEANEYKYLGFTFQKNVGMEAHLRKRVKKAGGVTERDREERQRLCRVCGWKEKRWEHVLGSVEKGRRS